MVAVAVTEQPYSGTKMECLTRINIAELSQAELHGLSLCSDSAFDLRRCDDVVVPNIDRSLFNESAGSRRQTYSRSRLHPRPRFPSSIPATSDDPEDNFIINYLKKLINPNDSFLTPPPLPVSSGHVNGTQEMAIVVHSGERKRKRGRKSTANKLQENGVGIELEMLNRNGVPVDLAALVDADNVYSAELKRRTTGLETEEDVLGFLRGLEGQWGSRRKKRKIVNASEFGDSLPIGWKILLGLKRREGHVSIYCRRYISPIGQQFMSCKEAASFLKYYFAGDDVNLPMGQSASTQKAQRVDSTSPAGLPQNPDKMNHHIISNSTLVSPPVADAHDKDISLMGIDNLAEVQVRDLFECYKCNMSFDERNAYLQHLLSFHQKTTKRYGLSMSVGEGVIIKDGKFECQFCHKIFLERRSYNGHVGIHVRNYFKGSEDLPATLAVHETSGCPLQDEFPANVSKVDALIEIVPTSILETSNAGHNNKPSGDSFPNKLNMEDTSATNALHDFSVCSEIEIKAYMANKPNMAIDQELTQQNGMTAMVKGEMVNIYDRVDVGNSVNLICSNTSEQQKLVQVESIGNTELKIDFDGNQVKLNPDITAEIPVQNIQEAFVQNGVSDSSTHVVKSMEYSVFTTLCTEGENEFGVDGKNPDNVLELEELRFDEI